MVGGLGQALDDLGRAVGVDARAEDDLLEEVGADQAGAGEGGEDAVRVEELEGEQVDVLVAARRARHLVGAVRELRRVEDDHVETLLALAVLAQHLEDVADVVLVVPAGELIQRHLLLGEA